ncbi:MAG: NosD domain-containing protein [Candidatus Thorarchaeota archaeon]
MVKSVYVYAIFLVLIISFSLSNSVVLHGESGVSVVKDSELLMIPADSYIPHGPIVISNNNDFVTQGWPGSGTLVEPFIIEGLNITADEVCISITNTTVYFEISDCLMFSGGVSSFDGIILENVTHGTVRNCNVHQHHMGISLLNSNNCILTGNTASNNSWYGFRLANSISCTLINNTAFANLMGFYMGGSDNGTLMNNTASSNSINGFVVLSCHNSLLTDNTAIGNATGFFLDFSDNCTLTYNTASSAPRVFYEINGFYLQDMDYCTLTHNTAFSNSRDGFNINSSNNCTLMHNTAFSNQRNGITLRFSSDNTTLYLNQLGNNGESNALDDGENNTWDDGVSQGNYWLDYSGNGTYPIPGNAGSVDHYPFVWEPETTTTTGGGDNTILFLVIICSGIAVVVIVTVIYMKKRNR